MGKIVMAVLLVAALAVSGCVSGSRDVSLKFITDGAGETVDGNVLMNGVPIGETTGGLLTVEWENLSAGEVGFTGEYRGRAFNLLFTISPDNLKSDEIDFEISREELDSYTMFFSVNETGEPLDGDVHLGNKYMGKASRGNLTVDVGLLFPATLVFNGSYLGKPFEFNFAFGREDMAIYSQQFVVPEGQLAETLFDAAKLDMKKAEEETLRLVNVERVKLGSLPFREYAPLSAVAGAYSQKILLTGQFSHNDSEGKSVNERLTDALIFHTIANENLASTGYLGSGTTETSVAESFVNGWMGSPGHRSTIVDRDGHYTDVGVGVRCGDRECYATMVFAGMEMDVTYMVNENSCWSYLLYDPSYSFDFSAPARIRVNASGRLDVYLVRDRQTGVDQCVNMAIPVAVKQYTDTSYAEESVSVEKGYALIISTGNKGTVTASVLADFSV